MLPEINLIFDFVIIHYSVSVHVCASRRHGVYKNIIIMLSFLHYMRRLVSVSLLKVERAVKKLDERTTLPAQIATCYLLFKLLHIYLPGLASGIRQYGTRLREASLAGRRETCAR